MNDLIRKIPSINIILSDIRIDNHPLDRISKKRIITNELASIKTKILNSEITSFDQDEFIEYIITKFVSPNNLFRVINGTGTILHTNLGRSPIPEAAIKNLDSILVGYSNLEYSLENRGRGDRESILSDLILELTGAEDCCVVNNNASAVFITLNSLSDNKKVVVARGENVEIGGGFRIPEIIERSGSIIKDVGTTNKTYFEDYKKAIESDKEANMILKIHTSNYSIDGFTHSASIKELAALKSKDVYLVEDQGSGTLIDLSKYTNLPKMDTVRDSLEAGADIVTFSGDKLLGGCQAGIIVGKKELINKIKHNQLFRMLRTGKHTTAILEEVLKIYRNEHNAVNTIPALRMITEKSVNVKERADKLVKLINNSKLTVKVLESEALIGGGSLPNKHVSSYALVISTKDFLDLSKYLSTRDIPVIHTLRDKEIFIDLKAVSNDEIEIIGGYLNDY